MAHYRGGYDEHFILKWFVKNNIKPSTIFKGTKLMYMNVGKRFRFMDSLNFIPVGLDKFPSTFRLESQKGFFPHKFNTPENFIYVGKILNKNYFAPD